MITLNFEENFVEEITDIIAEKVTEKVLKNINTANHLPILLTRQEAMEILQCGPSKMSELLRRPDFPVFRECGVRIPSHLLMEWIDKNTDYKRAGK